MKSGLMIILLFLVLILPTVFGGIESLFTYEKLSRGMTFYFIAFVLLLAIPFMNKYFKTISIFMIALFLSRGLMRISDEQDPIRTFLSIEPGIVVGLLIAVPLVLASFLGSLMLKTLARAGGVVSKYDEVVEQINRGRRDKKSLGEIKSELLDDGYTLKEINKAIEDRGKKQNE